MLLIYNWTYLITQTLRRRYMFTHTEKNMVLLYKKYCIRLKNKNTYNFITYIYHMKEVTGLKMKMFHGIFEASTRLSLK